MYVIGPVKQEDEWDRPRIVRYHDIMSNEEIEKVKELAKPRVSPVSELRRFASVSCRESSNNMPGSNTIEKYC